jgi:2-phospho-L-lactate transferase/gluconeogenesis factor (CofD/UPF0052 family)
VSDHLRAIEQVTGQRIFDVVLVQKRPPSPEALQHYAQVGAAFVELDRETVLKMGYRLLLADVIHEDPQKWRVQHDSQRLAQVLMRWYRRVQAWW